MDDPDRPCAYVHASVLVYQILPPHLTGQFHSCSSLYNHLWLPLLTKLKQGLKYKELTLLQFVLQTSEEVLRRTPSKIYETNWIDKGKIAAW